MTENKDNYEENLSPPEKAEATKDFPSCGPGCGCGEPPLKDQTKLKIIIFLVVIVAVASVLFFTAGTIFSLMIIGGIAGYVGQTAQTSLGSYWKIFAGIVAILFGLATLKLLPFNFPAANRTKSSNLIGKLGPSAAGLLMGGGVAASSLPCNPGIFIVLGAAVLQGEILWATLLLAMFAVGFSLPLGAVLLGVSLGKTALLSKNADTTIRWVSGCILLVAGFYLLITY